MIKIISVMPQYKEMNQEERKEFRKRGFAEEEKLHNQNKKSNFQDILNKELKRL